MALKVTPKMQVSRTFELKFEQYDTDVVFFLVIYKLYITVKQYILTPIFITLFQIFYRKDTCSKQCKKFNLYVACLVFIFLTLNKYCSKYCSIIYNKIFVLRQKQLSKNKTYSLCYRLFQFPIWVLKCDSFVLLINVGLNYLLCLILQYKNVPSGNFQFNTQAR